LQCNRTTVQSRDGQVAALQFLQTIKKYVTTPKLTIRFYQVTESIWLRFLGYYTYTHADKNGYRQKQKQTKPPHTHTHYTPHSSRRWYPEVVKKIYTINNQGKREKRP